MVVVDTLHQSLSELVAGMMGEACGRPAPRPHSSFFALGGTEAQAAELSKTVNALFALDLPVDAILRSPTPDALARTIGWAWDGTPADLVDLIRAIADAQ